MNTATTPAIGATPPARPAPAASDPASALRFRRIEVRRMPGLGAGPFAVEDLSPGVNVLFGPNGCGKSRTAAAMNALLWPRAGVAKRASLAGSFSLGEAVWRVDLDANVVRYQRDGAEVESGPALLPPAETRDRYNLPLQDLLGKDHRAFAETILRESAGGFDLRGAATALEFRPGPSALGSLRKDADAHRSALAAIDDAERQQRNVQGEEKRLADLERDKAAARAARLRMDVLRDALAYHDALASLAQAERALAAFPPAVAKLTGGEWKAYEELSGELRAAETRHRDADGRRVEAAAALAGAKLPDSGVPDTLVESLVETHRLVREVEQQRQLDEHARRTAEAERNAARAKIAPALTDERLSVVVAGNIKPFEDLARQAESARAAAAAHDALAEWVGQVAAPTPAELDALREGVSLLQRWLREPPPAPGVSQAGGAQVRVLRLLVWAGACAILLIAVVLAIAVHPAWAALALLAGVLLAAMLILSRSAIEPPAAPSRRELAADDYARLPLSQPAVWDVPTVEQLLAETTRQQAVKHVDQQKSERWEGLAKRRADCRPALQALTARQEEFAKRLGAEPETGETALYLLASNVIAWQEADRRAMASSAACAQSTDRCAGELQKAAGRLTPLGYEVNDAGTLHAAIEHLRVRQTAFARAGQAQADAERHIADAARQITQLQGKIDSIFEAAELPPGEALALCDQCEQQPACRAAVQAHDQARRDVEASGAKLSGDASLGSTPRGEIEAMLVEAAAQAARLEDISQEAGGIAQRVDAAKAGHDVEAALARRDDAAEALRRRRDADFDAVAGWALTEFLKAETRDHHRPAVFGRAKTLLSRITHGRWRLDFDDAEPPTFRATETASETGHGLDEMSSGTRLQLLLAVRVAFVEEQERGTKLPLFFDEALANSDEQRARAIIEAAVELARSGRQIFYLTAQADEVGKWKGILESAGDVPHRLIDLAAVRGLAETERLPLRELALLPGAQVPSPEGLEHAAYGAVLKAPAFDVRAASIGGTHLWHVVDDVTVLHMLLKRGLSTWGQLQEFLGHPLVHDLPDACRRAEAAAKVLDAMRAGWTIGRGRAVDREAILDSGAVSPVFQPPVVELLQSVGGDAAQMLEGLRDKRVKGFRSNSIDDLQAFLAAHGFLDERPTLSRDEIRGRMIGGVGAEIRDGLIDVGRIDAYLATWCPDLVD